MELTEKEKKAREMLCYPLDGIESIIDLRTRVGELSPVVKLFKIGKETYTKFGPRAVEIVQEYGVDVFLDLKYHDIPNTVKGAAKAAAELGVSMFNVHASGGVEMMEAAVEGVNSLSASNASGPKIVGVTVLTSLDNLRYVQGALPIIRSLPVKESHQVYVEGLSFFPFNEAIHADIAVTREKNPEKKVELQKKYLEDYGEPFDKLLRNLGLENLIPDSVLNFAQMTMESRLDGIVCSAADLYAVRDKLPEGFMYVTPGIKGVNTPAGEDQKRVFNPGNAVQDGSSILVVGRAITNAPDKVQAGYEILQDMAKYL